ncbi:hypothetical protein M3215_22835 [Bacillus cytotoxicus]|uniref:Uncharacterized protein n=1 Tax=Bacillus cytotoxicus TaxID=580165 RepID=A0ACC6ADU9_9BACI|nr:hypothetical protein [Bacillus cytotoxicus]
MPEIQYIKHLRENKDLTISEIARKTGNNWRTVKKYADGSVHSENIVPKKRGMMYEEGYGEITVDKKRFVLRKARMKQTIIVKKEWDQFTCFTNDGEVIYQEYRSYMNVTREIPWNEISGDWEKKPRAMCYSRFFPYLPERVQAYLLFKKEDIRKRIIGLRELLIKHSLQQLNEHLEQEERLHRDPHELGFLIDAKNIPYPDKWEEIHTPTVLVDYETDLCQYDRKLCPSLEGGIQS